MPSNINLIQRRRWRGWLILSYVKKNQVHARLRKFVDTNVKRRQVGKPMKSRTVVVVRLILPTPLPVKALEEQEPSQRGQVEQSSAKLKSE